MTRISCPKCKTVLQATPEQAGKTIACPSCQTQMRLPSSRPQPQPAVVGPPPLPDQAVPPPPAGNPNEEWYYAKDGQKVGPVTKNDLKALVRTGQLSGNDMVWRAGMAGWKPASQVKGLFESGSSPLVRASEPPPLPVQAVVHTHADSDGSPSYATGSLPWLPEERNSPNTRILLELAGVGVGVFLVFLAVVFNRSDAAGPAFLFGMLLIAAGAAWWVFDFFGLWLHGRWVPVDGAVGWVEFLKGGIIKRENGMVGTFVLSKNRKFIDILVSGRLVDSWKILSLGQSSLEIQDMAGKTHSYKKGKTLEQKQASLFYEDRSRYLWHKWEPVDGSGPAIQFTEDGAMIRFDGFAARYTFSGEEPNEVVTIHVDDTEKVVLKVLSLGRDELVLAGEGGTRHYKRGVSISDAEAQRRADAFNEKLKTVGKAALVTAGAIGAGIAILGVAAAAAGGSGAGRNFGGGIGSEPMATCDRCKMKIPIQSEVCPYCHASHRPGYY